MVTPMPRKDGLARYRNEYIAAASATLSLMATVAAAGWSSPAIPLLKRPDSHIPITPDEGSWIASILSIGAIVGPIFMNMTIDRYGRKLTLIFMLIPLIIGWIMVVFATDVVTLYIARFLHGISYGAAYSAAPIYLGEISSNAIRGSTGVLITVMAKLAFLLEYSIGPYVSFRSLAYISLSFPILFLAVFIWMPETPYHYLNQGNEEAALKSLRWLRRSDYHCPDLRREFHEMKMLVEKNRQNRSSVGELFKRTNRKSLGIILLLSFGMQLTGINAILSYSQTIFAMLAMDLSAAELSIIMGAVQLFAVFIPTFFVDKAGRRPLLLTSCGGSLLGLSTCSIYFTLVSFGYDMESLSWIPFAATLFFIVSFAIGLATFFFFFFFSLLWRLLTTWASSSPGLATVPFAILGEVFPKNIKSNANAAFGMITSVMVFTVVKLFQVISDGAGTHVSFWIFAVCTGTTMVLIYFLVPETKGKSFEEIQNIMQMMRGEDQEMIKRPSGSKMRGHYV